MFEIQYVVMGRKSRRSCGMLARRVIKIELSDRKCLADCPRQDSNLIRRCSRTFVESNAIREISLQTAFLHSKTASRCLTSVIMG